MRFVVAIVLITFCLSFYFGFIFKLKKKVIDLENTYPTTDCDQLQKLYGKDNIRFQAGFTYFEEKYDHNLPKYGALYCFCDNKELDQLIPGATKYDTYVNRH